MLRVRLRRTWSMGDEDVEVVLDSSAFPELERVVAALPATRPPGPPPDSTLFWLIVEHDGEHDGGRVTHVFHDATLPAEVRPLFELLP
ncbi:hypothetical protein [Nonomuraea sp. NPDC048916]|uniref:hypothetical protein n=1 Tax=Nonomuraea sp. NPDC048916 TaxID=3154232 RepID=UPI00340ECD04